MEPPARRCLAARSGLVYSLLLRFLFGLRLCPAACLLLALRPRVAEPGTDEENPKERDGRWEGCELIRTNPHSYDHQRQAHKVYCDARKECLSLLLHTDLRGIQLGRRVPNPSAKGSRPRDSMVGRLTGWCRQLTPPPNCCADFFSCDSDNIMAPTSRGGTPGSCRSRRARRTCGTRRGSSTQGRSSRRLEPRETA